MIEEMERLNRLPTVDDLPLHKVLEVVNLPLARPHQLLRRRAHRSQLGPVVQQLILDVLLGRFHPLDHVLDVHPVDLTIPLNIRPEPHVSCNHRPLNQLMLPSGRPQTVVVP
uniref:(northern house mosquito) hypothetical protein n=1 Tax=Culex pipiens TaxID=7175 RepID=A0A8D8GK95_CULPI